MLSLRVYAAWTGPLSSGTDISGRVDLHGCAPPLRNHTHVSSKDKCMDVRGDVAHSLHLPPHFSDYDNVPTITFIFSDVYYGLAPDE